LLLVEVADTSDLYDRGTKVPMYARAGISEVWLVRLAQNTVEVYTAPVNGRYQTVRTFAPGEILTPQSLAAISVRAEELFR
jgi:Uma2 family endonuclease